MFIDTHMHEKTYSKDSFLSLEEIVTIARLKGLDGICITDHDSIGLKEYAEEYSKKTGFPIFVGVEYYSLQGDIVAFGIDRLPAGRIDAQSFIDRVKDCGGVCFAAHPFRNNNRGLEEKLSAVHGLDGIEALNGSTLPDANKKAFQYARMLGIQPVGASDCHVPGKVGRFATYFPEPVSTLEEFIEAFKKGGLTPAYYENGRYHAIKETDAIFTIPDIIDTRAEAIASVNLKDRSGQADSSRTGRAQTKKAGYALTSGLSKPPPPLRPPWPPAEREVPPVWSS